MITFTCSHCKQPLSVPESSGGRIGQCPHCGSFVDIPAANPAEPPPPPPPNPSAVVATPVSHVSSAPPPPPQATVARDAGPAVAAAAGSPNELTVCSILMGTIGFLVSPGIVLVRYSGAFASVLLGLAVLGLGGLGLVLAILSLLRGLSQRSPGFWYNLTALILSGLAILVGLTLFIAALAMGSPFARP